MLLFSNYISRIHILLEFWIASFMSLYSFNTLFTETTSLYLILELMKALERLLWHLT